MNWKRSIYSEVNAQFVSNPYPSSGETIKISLRISRKNPVLGVFLRTLVNGSSRKYAMSLERSGNLFSYYVTEVTMDYRVLAYSFELDAGDEYLFYTRTGVSRVHPVEDANFIIFADYDNPSWLPGAVFYQIFPDRFRKGAPDMGVRTGEYRFDGHETIELEWGSEPPEFADGHCLDFYNGNLPGIQEAIPYLQELGVNAIFLNPIFRARTNHRYDCIDYFTVDEHLGGNEALQDLTRELHSQGMKVIVDVSINHTGIEHEWFRKALADPDCPEAGYYYRVEPETEPGDGKASPGSREAGPDSRQGLPFVFWEQVHTLPQLNYSNPALADLFWNRADAMFRKFLAAPYEIDGWRLDVGNQVGRYREHQFCHDIWRSVRQAVKEENPEAYIVGEYWEDPAAYLKGDQWDGAMNYFGSGRLLRRWMGERDRYLTEGWGHSPERGPFLTGDDLAGILVQFLSRIPNQLAFRQMNLIDTHDTPRLHNNEEVFSWSLYRGVVMMLFMLPGPVSYFYGDEILIDGHVHSIEGARYPMDWSTGNREKDSFSLYRFMGRLKSSEPALAEGGWKILLSAEKVLVFSRFLHDTAFILVLNRDDRKQVLHIPVGEIGVVEAVEMLSGEPGRFEGDSLNAYVPAGESLLYRCITSD